MLPASAVSGFYFAHPDSAYFGVARIGRTSSRTMPSGAGSTSTPRAWLRPNLD
jgi:5-methyltetrahydrofolate--homocysteine methyltransferase